MGDCVGILGLRQDQEDQDPHRSPHVVTLTSRHILSPLDTARAVACPEGPSGGGRVAVARPAGDGAGTAKGNTRAASRRGASRPDASRKGAVCGSHVAQNALFRHVAAPGRCGTTARQAAGHYGKWLNWVNALEQPPARRRGGVVPGPADLGLESDLTERRTLPNLRAADCAFP